MACSTKETPKENEKKIKVGVRKIGEEYIYLPVRTSGRLTAESEQKLSFRTGGIIKRILVKEGQEVSPGETIAELNLSEIKPQVSMARQAFDKASRDLQRAENLFNDSVATLEMFQNAKRLLK
ncbi:MAG: biotin/lipoyl-binding protein [Bacteroidales bacterium]|nr:biotin/lipoyl-binding protein [Bacteroidales bacterium]